MTLILDCITRDSIYQVADRRITQLAPPHDPIDDEANKSIVVDGRAVFGFAGLAEIVHPERTDQWLVRTLTGEPSPDFAAKIAHLRIAASAAFRVNPLSANYKQHAFRCTGWFRLQGEPALSPGLLTVHNALDHKTGNWIATARDDFEVSTEFLTNADLRGGCIIKSIGEPIHNVEKDAVVRFIRKCVNHRYSTPHRVMSGLIRAFRWLAARHHDRVGMGLIAVSLPRRSVEQAEQTGQITMINAPANDQAATFLYVSASGRTSVFGPHLVADGTAIVGFEGGPLPRHA